MARKLPWSIANTNTTARNLSSSTRPPKRVKTEAKHERDASTRDPPSSSPISSKAEPISSPIRDNATKRIQDRTRDGRSPSTSPPPAPPPVELMRSGLEEDDIYMLVEDEFQAVAQSYTAHLHHAEYKRLMKLAKERKAEQKRVGMDILDGSSRIPDNVTPETEQRLKRELLAKRQSSGVKSMLSGGLLNGGDDEESDEDEAREAILAREEKKVGDMWAGTALGGLMSWDHSQEKTSLKGLDRIGGETRASRGFGPSNGAEDQAITNVKGKQKHRHASEIEDADRSKRTQKPERGQAKQPIVAVSHRDGGPKSYTKPSEQSSSEPKPDQQSRNTTTTAKVKIKREPTKPTTTGRSRYRSFIDSLDDFDDASFDASQALANSVSPEKPSLKSTSSKDKAKQKKDRKDRLDEVPVFLI